MTASWGLQYLIYLKNIYYFFLKILDLVMKTIENKIYLRYENILGFFLYLLGLLYINKYTEDL